MLESVHAMVMPLCRPCLKRLEHEERHQKCSATEWGHCMERVPFGQVWLEDSFGENECEHKVGGIAGLDGLE